VTKEIAVARTEDYLATSPFAVRGVQRIRICGVLNVNEACQNHLALACGMSILARV
jgi:hypothetical protein